MNHILSGFLSDTISSLENLRKNDVCKEYSCVFKCAELEDYLNHDIRDSVKYCGVFKELMEIKGPVLYWYEIISDHSNDEIMSSLLAYKQQKNHRIIPVLYKGYNRKTTILYVGKCKKKVLGACHSAFGIFQYTDNTRTSALSLGKGDSSGSEIACLGVCRRHGGYYAHNGILFC